MKHSRKAQNTLEYLIILSAITAAIILFAITVLPTTIGKMYGQSAQAVVNMTNQIEF